jgi:hypothetical protein
MLCEIMIRNLLVMLHKRFPAQQIKVAV